MSRSIYTNTIIDEIYNQKPPSCFVRFYARYGSEGKVCYKRKTAAKELDKARCGTMVLEQSYGDGKNGWFNFTLKEGKQLQSHEDNELCNNIIAKADLRKSAEKVTFFEVY